MVRINKYISNSGVCSRRKAEDYIINGKVKVNDKVIFELGTIIDESLDTVYLNDVKISLQTESKYIMLNKPKGYITTNNEQFDRPCTMDLIHEQVRLFPIGRLDMDTEGLLLFTNDGEFANKLIHPKNEIQKVYIVDTGENLTQNQIDMLTNGVDIGDYITRPANVTKLNQRRLKIVITEGKYRQVRRMCDAVNLTIKRLRRVQVGNLEIGDLKLGSYRELTLNEIKNITR